MTSDQQTSRVPEWAVIDPSQTDTECWEIYRDGTSVESLRSHTDAWEVLGRVEQIAGHPLMWSRDDAGGYSASEAQQSAHEDLRCEGVVRLYQQARELIDLTTVQRSALADARELTARLRDELTAAHQSLYRAEARLLDYRLASGPRWVVMPPTVTAAETWRIYRHDELVTELDVAELTLDDVLHHVDEIAGGRLSWQRDPHGDGVWTGRVACPDGLPSEADGDGL